MAAPFYVTNNPWSGGYRPSNPWSNPYSGSRSWLEGYDLDFLNSPEGLKSSWQMLIDRSNSPARAKDWLGTKFNDYYNNYQAEVSRNPTLDWTDYLSNMDIQKEYTSIAPQTRGLNSSAQATRMKYLGW